ncbi:class I SAM-dependent methyltransferase [Myxococcota bacterium]|nr:class I SAM-dependent methyltransferase [Myxococcota bacterium]
MGLYEEKVLPHLTVYVLDTGTIRRQRTQALEGARGRVLELGFGAGLNLPHYPKDVSAVVGVDPSEASAKLAEKRIAEAPFTVEHVALKGEELPVDAHSFDTAVSTFTLCTIPDVAKALANVREALKPGAKLHFLEHGRSPDRWIRFGQALWNPFQRWVGGGCHVNRPIDHLVTSAGFELESLETFYLPGPKVISFFYRGVARVAG